MTAPEPKLDIALNRQSRKWSRKELVGRVLWAACRPLFRFSPRLCWTWRCGLLRCFGARIGRHVQIHPSVLISIPWQLSVGDWSSIGFDALIYNLGPIEIGTKVTISQRAHLCAGTHDFRDPAMLLLKLPISIRDEAWICADAYIGPGVTIGARAVTAARSVVVKDVAAGMVVGGNPAKTIGPR
jgi:putative colanic acid biosynthesis acetyltransferase WcaF